MHTTVAISKDVMALAKDLCTVLERSSPKELFEDYVKIMAKKKKAALIALNQQRIKDAQAALNRLA